MMLVVSGMMLSCRDTPSQLLLLLRLFAVVRFVCTVANIVNAVVRYIVSQELSEMLLPSQLLLRLKLFAAVSLIWCRC
jgi:hypothetical protein